MQFMDRKNTSLRSLRSVRIDKPYMPSLAPLMRCRLRTVNGPLRTVYHFSVHTIRTDRNMDYLDRKVRVYWTTLGEVGGRITLPAPVAPTRSHLF